MKSEFFDVRKKTGLNDITQGPMIKVYIGFISFGEPQEGLSGSFQHQMKNFVSLYRYKSLYLNFKVGGKVEK